MFLKFLAVFSISLGLSLSGVTMVDAKDKGGKAQVKGGKKNVKVKGPKKIPPGQVKRYTRGAKLPDGLDFVDIGDLSKWKMPKPGKGNKYIQLDGEILEISDAGVVIEAVGIVGDLLR